MRELVIDWMTACKPYVLGFVIGYALGVITRLAF